MNYNNLLILERSSSTLIADEKSGNYVLEGIFGEIDKKNKNNRIYTEGEYVPQIEALQEKIKSSKLLGELDHPAKFDVSLKNVSHIIEELYYDSDLKQVKGKIRLLDTDAGRQAKALVDAGVPLQISSRAAGEVSEGGQVKIKQLFTYDLVADPGFANAELNRVNESFGFESDSNIQIFEMMPETLVTETENIKTENNTNNTTSIMENQARFVSVEDFNKYSTYLAEEIKALKESLAGTSTEDIEEKMEALTNYVEHVAEKADQGIQYTEYIAENLDKSIDYSNYVAEKLDNSISYSEHVAEAASNVKEYANYLAEAMNEGAADYENVTKYLNYLKENVESVSEYADYIAETINTNLIVETEVANDGDDVTGTEADDLKSDAKEVNNDVNAPEDKSAELEADLAKDAAPSKEVVESDIKANDGDDVTGVEADDLKSDAKEINNDVNAPEDKSAELEADLAKDAAPSKEVVESEEAEEEAEEVVESEEAEEEVAEEEAEEVVESEEAEEEAIEESCGTCGANPCECASESVDAVEAYKNEISEKLSALINKATVKENNNPHFFKLVSEATQEKYNALEEADKTKVLSSIEGRGYLTEGQINTLMESALVEVAGQTTPYFVEAMPSEYKETWAKLSEAKKSVISAQARMVKLTTPYQVKNFWDTRDLRETSAVMERVEMITEAKKIEAPKSTLTYNTDGIGEALAKRFKK